MTRAAHVLVVGAGPTGLVLALQAHDHGAQVRIVERRLEAFRPSRALIMHPRTLEVLRPLEVTEALLARAVIAPEVHVHLGSREVPIRLDDLALPDTSFPHLSLLRQMDVEQVLSEALADRGVQVERGTELVEVWVGENGARVTLRSGAAVEKTDFDFVAGCDGPASTVRSCAGIAWPGDVYREEVVLADAELDGDLIPGVAHAVVGRGGLLLLFPLGERATWRLLATRPSGSNPLPFGQPGSPVPVIELQALLDEAGLPARVTDLVWSAPYRLQHRLARWFRQGPLFLAGDAAHAYSPATGQGMNTGIQDATNLGWKLALAASATDPSTLLDSYDLERRPVARQMLVLTHLAFWAEASTRLLPSLLRGMLAPLGVPALSAFLVGQRRLLVQILRLLSQMWVAYPNSPLSVEGRTRMSDGPHVGHRLPDATVTSGDCQVRLHALLARPGVPVLLQRDANQLEHLALGCHVTVHRLTSTPGEGLVAVRPDGYVGFRCGIADLPQLRAWLGLIGAGKSAGTGDRARPIAPPLPLQPQNHL